MKPKLHYAGIQYENDPQDILKINVPQAFQVNKIKIFNLNLWLILRQNFKLKIFAFARLKTLLKISAKFQVVSSL